MWGQANWKTLAGAGVHVFTALGSVCALLAMLSVFDGAYARCFGWLFLALAIDAVDGALARAVDLENRLPRFSGERLDLVIDYLTYVFVPVLALLHARILDGVGGQVLAALALLSSLFHFSDTASKTEDNCFVGFPAVWNIVAFLMFAWGLRGLSAGAVVLALVALTFVPMRWLHPMRVQRLHALNILMTACGLVAGLWIVWSGFPGDLMARGVIAVVAAYYLALALWWPRATPDEGHGT